MKSLKWAVAALYLGLAVTVAMGAYAVREGVRKIESIERGIDKLVKPTPIVGMPTWRVEEGKVIYSRDVTVSSPIVLEGLEILVHADGLHDVKLLAANDKNAIADIVLRPDGVYRIYIKHPFGTYRVEAVTPRTVPVTFNARF